VSDELKDATELLGAYADEFADATIGENTELTSNMQRRLSDAIRVVLAAIAKREAAAEEISAEMYIVGGETFFDCAKQYGISGSTENDQNAAARIYRAMIAASQQAAKNGETP